MGGFCSKALSMEQKVEKVLVKLEKLEKDISALSKDPNVETLKEDILNQTKTPTF